ncbi:DUF2169 family type VI secretion system accessory protein [Paraliomyxa miuraensis]|uniref:DUF2169 family type VI secretion system accessory protein n=1 Tax=Paraliomyxa miuraensis TaxID=376150 RepID=UPI00224EDA00|nr:DUF2169 domain-containing protein [Paraliomyxa miuraensis]MCX4239742.1 DUF2169 domain-containing protein [Paraliomyxa miuraensis]
MWALDNRTPYEAERGWVLDVSGAKHWVVVVKATFDIRPDGSLVLSEEPVPPLLAPRYFGEDGSSSLQYDADLVGPKAATDVLAQGSAHAPGSKPTARVNVALQLGKLRKIIEVQGDREHVRDVYGQAVPSPAMPFLTMPIIYERAFGGFDQTRPQPAAQRMDPRNPVGKGVAAKAKHLLGTPVANLSFPGQNPKRSGPAGFGPIACHWSPRRELAGTYDARWVRERRPLLPEDFDPRFHQCAPLDQQLAPHLRGGELLELVNMTPGGVLRVELPKIYLALTTHFGFQTKEHRTKLVTVLVEPDVPRVIMVWQSVLPCHHLVDVLDKTVVRQKPYV